jgi:acyl carrier protein
MTEPEKILEAVYRAVDGVNSELPPNLQIVKAPETRLYGPQSLLDSFSLVNLIVATEREIEDAFGVSVVLASDRAMSQKRSPFLTIGSLASYIQELLVEAAGQPAN